MTELILEFQNNDICDLISNNIKEYISNDESINIHNNLLSLNYNDNNDELIEYLSLVLYIQFANYYNNKNLHTWITHDYFFINAKEINEIIDKIKDKVSLINLSFNENLEEDSLLNYIKNDEFYNSLKTLITTTNTINIRGLITFRYKIFTASYEDCLLSPIISEFIKDKEDKEFLKLLKYFVDINDEFYDEVIIKFLENGEKVVIDNDNNDLIEKFKAQCEEITLIDDNTPINNILLSGFVSKVPKLIKVHNINNLNEDDTKFIDTLQMLFNVEIVIP